MSKIIIVTGASSGFGAAISRVLVQRGHKVVGIARREAKLTQLKNELGEAFFPLVLDVSDEVAVNQLLNRLPPAFQPIDVLVNNAGLALGLSPAHEASLQDWQTMIQTNIVGFVTITHAVLPAMVARDAGQIINMGSIAGNYPYPGGNVYGGTKAFVKQFSLNLRADLAGTHVRVSNIEPGLCGDTEFSTVRFHGDASKAASIYDNIDYLTPQDIANTVVWIIDSPAHVNINRVEIMPVAQSFAPLSVSKNKKGLS